MMELPWEMYFGIICFCLTLALHILATGYSRALWELNHQPEIEP